jgi:hypothetical protein
MPELVTNCPRCGSQKITFDVNAANPLPQIYTWQSRFETYCICRHCNLASIFVLVESVNVNHEYVHRVGILQITGSLNHYYEIEGYVSLKDESTVIPPEHMPKEIKAVFNEGTTCLAVLCYNAAGTMFRLCVDLATRAMLPEEDVVGLNAKVRRDLGLRLPWLFAKGILPETLRELSICIKEDGNDGAHAGTLKQIDVEDLLDFTTALLERIYTEPERLRLAQERRDSRREKKE